MATPPAASAPPTMEYNEPVIVNIGGDGFTAEELAEYKRHYRLGLPFAQRVIFGTLSATTVGFLLGATHGAKREGLRFRAENAHRLPTSQKGWYFYHKSKNYAAMFGGAKEGVRMGLKTGIWVAAFVGLEAAADHHRERLFEADGGQQDFLSTMTAGVTSAALWSAWHRFPAATTVRTGKLGLKIGLGFGLMQDALGYARGRRITYIEYGKKLFGIGKTESAD